MIAREHVPRKSVLDNIAALESHEPFDVCIIGSGFVGTILGNDLVERGVRTLILESGDSLLRWLIDKRLKQLAAYEVSGDADYPTLRTKARAIGGNSNFWTGRCERFHPSDFERHSYTPADNPWPMTYPDLEPYYEQAEKTLRVRGNSLSEYVPWRKNDLPIPARSNISSLQSMLAKIKVTVDESPTATPKHALRFFRLHKEVLPRFLSSTNGVFASGSTVTKLHGNSNRNITHAEVRSLDGATRTARAKIFVVACGGIETPRLLLLSQSSAFPKGIGNSYDRVGKGFNEHPGVNFFANMRHSWDTIYPRHKIGRSHQFYEQFRGKGLGSVLPVFIQSWVFPNHLIFPKLSNMGKSLIAFAKRTIRPSLYIGATIEMLPRDENCVTLAKHKTDCFGNPLAHLHLAFSEQDRATLEQTRQLVLNLYDRLGAQDVREAELTWSRHHLGTCRMGDDPKRSVTNGNLRVHDCHNLYLCGGETFVTGAAVPPVLTIAALAHRLSDHLIARLREG